MGRRGKGAEQEECSTFCAGDKSEHGTDEEQMKRWHRGGRQQSAGTAAPDEEGPVFFGTPWISTPTTQVGLFCAAPSGRHVCICSASDIIRDIVPVTAGRRGRSGRGRGHRVSQIASLGT